MKKHYSPSDKYATTRAQREAILRLFVRANPHLQCETHSNICAVHSPLYRAFRKQFQMDRLMGCLMVNLWGMWIGIETDGYTHS